MELHQRLNTPNAESMNKYEQAVKYWQEKLSSPPFLPLPTDYPRHSDQVVEAEVVRRIDTEVCRAVLKYSLKSGDRPYTLVLAAFAIVLHRYTREEDILIGSSASSGNPLPLRLSLDGLTQLREVVSREEASKNDIPLTLLLAGLDSTSEANHFSTNTHQSLFQACCFNAVDVKKDTLDAIAVGDWKMFVEQDADSKLLLPLKIRFTYNTVLFSRERINELLLQVEEVMTAIANNGDSTVDSVSLFNPNTQSGQLLPNPRDHLDDTWEGSIMEHLAAWADKDPQRIAVVHKTTKYNYGYINGYSNKIANYLISKGIKQEDVVTLYAHRSTILVVGIMGILKAGATFSVIDPLYPTDRQIIYLNVARPIAIVQFKLAGELNADVQDFIDTKLRVVCQLKGLDIDNYGELEEVSAVNPQVKVGPNDIATLSFTSGSTGVPKAVRGRHISLTHFYPWMAKHFGLSECDRFTMLSGIAHDPIQRDVFTPMYLGACLYVPDFDDIMNPGQLATWISTYDITAAHLTPAMSQLLSANATTPMPTLRLVFLVGDILTRRDVMRLQNLAENVTVVNMYGTTETQRAVSYFEIKNDQSIHSQKEILPAGKGMKDVQLLVLTKNNTIAGIGELGEIFVRSPHLSNGYLGLLEDTLSKFLINPFTNHCEDRMYRTGDLGRYMPNGIGKKDPFGMECVGRADDQVKIRGFRIELREIDTFLGQHKDVRENVTLVRRDANEEKQIISYFVPYNTDYDIDSMRSFLKTKLPIYAIPSIFYALSRMPITPNGKIDRAKLPHPDAALMTHKLRNKQKEMIPSTLTPLHYELLNIWKSVLGHEVGIKDNFFDMGGHSISATRVTFEMRKKLRNELPLNMLYRYPTIDKLVNRINQVEADSTVDFDDRDECTTNKQIDLDKEVQLDSSITANDLPPFDPFGVHGILLTGATGFLGTFLLRALLKKYPQATVYCIVRAASDDEATNRIVQNMKSYLQWDAQYHTRILGVKGNLSEINCGMTNDQWTELSEKTSVIVHNGAWVHWVYPYAKLFPVNVQSTKELLRLATTYRVKSFHFVSSTAVFESNYYTTRNTMVRESEDLVAGNGIPTGYGQTKWVSEKIIMLASKRGVPTTIFRPGYITGDIKTGVMNVDDYLVRLLKGCLQMGQAPNMINRVNMCPVDFVANAIVHISARPLSYGRCFHLVNPSVFRFSNYFEALIQHGYDIKIIEYIAWRQGLEDLTITNKDNALYPLLHFVLDDLPTKSQSALLDASKLFSELANTNIRCPPIKEVMGVYLAYLAHIGYIPPPTVKGDHITPLPLLNLGDNARLVKRTGT